MNLRHLLFAGWFMLAAQVAAGSVSLLQSAVEKWAEEIDRWSFTQDVREFRGEKVREARVERFDPSQPDESRWKLISVNGRAPTRAEQRAFDARKNAKPRMRFDSPAQYIDFEQVTVVEETDNSVTFDVPLRANVSLLVPFEDVSARVVIDKATTALEHVAIGLRREMRIAFGLAKVKKLEMAFSLRDPAYDGDDLSAGSSGTPAPDGHARATITKLGRRVELTWSDFVRVEPRSSEPDRGADAR